MEVKQHFTCLFSGGATEARLTGARLRQPEVASSILSDFNVSFDCPVICVAVALNTRRKWSTDRGREGGKGRTIGIH